MTSGDLGFDPNKMPDPGQADFSHLTMEDVVERMKTLPDATVDEIVARLEVAREAAKSHREQLNAVIHIITNYTLLGLKFI